MFTTVLAFAALYAPQPLLPRLAAEFAVTPDQAGLLISVTLIPLGLAPVLYGLLLQSVSARNLLRVGILGLALFQLVFAAAPGFAWLLGARLAQGLLLPAVFTALMTYLSSMAEGARLRRLMSVYIAATILGGFSGRLFSGAMVGAGLPWPWVFIALAAALVLAWLWLGRLPADTKAGFGRVRAKDVRQLLADPMFRRAYGIIFLVFFVFASLLNLMPFRLKSLDASLGEFAIALVYSGYLVGIAIALGSVGIARRLGGEVVAIRTGLALYLAAVVLFVIPDFRAIFGLMWLFCAGMFLVHALLSGLVNQHAQHRKGVVNGLYIASYYLGGTVGAFAPALLYRWAGWNVYIASLVLAVIAAGVLALRLRINDIQL